MTMVWRAADGAISLNLHRLMMNLRKWQQEAVTACLTQFDKGRKLFVIEGCTGSGKSLCSATASIQLVEEEKAELVVVLTPNCGTRLGWKKTFEGLNINGRRINVTDDTNFPGDTDVWVSTYAGYSKIEEALSSRPVSGIIAIIDEFHHAEQSAEWGKAVDRLVSLADHAIFLSGTPWKREGKIAVLCGESNIHGENYYQEEGKIKADFVYDYKQDLRHPTTRGTVPVKFRFWDSKWEGPNGEICVFSKDLPAFPTKQWETIEDWEEWAKKCDSPMGRHLYFNLENGCPSDNKAVKNIINESLILLARSRREVGISCGSKNASVLLCVAKTVKDARRIAEYIQDERPSYRVSVVVSDDSNGAKKLEKIARQCKENAVDKPDVIVSVGMISEGVDIPQIKVVAYLSAILTVLHFVQVTGRAVRRMPLGGKNQGYADKNLLDTIAYVVAPAHPRLMYIARNIERDVQDACGDIVYGDENRSPKTSEAPQSSIKGEGTVTSGDNSSSIFRGSESFAKWHEVIEAMRMHELASDCYIDSHWAEHILGLFLRGDDRAEQYAIREIEGKCQCMNTSVDALTNQVEEHIETVLSYEEEQKMLSEKAIYWTNIIRFKIDKYRIIEDNDVAFRKVRGDINRLSGLKALGVSFSKASVEQRRHWVSKAREVAEGLA